MLSYVEGDSVVLHVVVLLKYSSQLPFGHIDGIFVAVDVARWSQLVLFVALFCDGVM